MTELDGVLVVNCKLKYIKDSYRNLEKWDQDPSNLYIGRGLRIFITENGVKRVFYINKSIWSNPFKVKEFGLEKSLEMYEEYIKIKIDTDDRYDLETLKGKRLGCWCKPNKCHGDVLKKLLDEKKKLS